MATKRENIAKELSNPRTRLVLAASAVIIVVVLVAAWAIMAKRNKSTAEALPSEVSAPPTMDATSGMQAGQPNVATAEYDALLAAGNKAEAAAAREQGASAIPTPRAGTANSAFDNEPGPIAQASAAANPGPGVATTNGQADASQAEQQRRQAWEQQVQARMQAMRGQMQKIDKYWAIQPHQRFQVQADTSASSAGAQQAQSQAPTQSSSYDAVTQSNDAVRSAQRETDIAMGDVMYGTLDFGINTDDPASANFVQATIRQPGPFQGAKVLGSLQEGDQYAKTVGIHFTQMKVPGEAGMRSIDAWAVSPNTQRASVASSVNNHYMSRGFSVLVGSFLEGYSQALLAGGRQQNIITTPNGSVVVQQDAYSTKQLAQVGVGNVGKNMGQMFAQAATRQRTVTVDAGADLGVWFLKDVVSGQ